VNKLDVVSKFRSNFEGSVASGTPVGTIGAVIFEVSSQTAAGGVDPWTQCTPEA